MNMNGTPSAYSQMGTPSSSHMSSMMGNTTPSIVEGRSPHFVRGKAPGPVGRQIVTAPDVTKLGEDLALRASSADQELKGQLKAEQYGVIILLSHAHGVHVRSRGRCSAAVPLNWHVVVSHALQFCLHTRCK